MAWSMQQFAQAAVTLREQAKESVRHSKAQPKDGSCYVISLDNSDRDTETKPNRVVNVRIENYSGSRNGIASGSVGPLLASRTHRMCTDDEVTDYLAEQAQKRRDIIAAHNQSNVKPTQFVDRYGNPIDPPNAYMPSEEAPVHTASKIPVPVGKPKPAEVPAEK